MRPPGRQPAEAAEPRLRPVQRDVNVPGIRRPAPGNIRDFLGPCDSGRETSGATNSMGWDRALRGVLHRLTGASYDHRASPIIIGATGGSGTRVIRSLLAHSGVFMGVRLNGPGDAMDFEPFLDDMINPTLEQTKSLDYELSSLPPSFSDPAVARLQSIVEQYRADHPAHLPAWGWKNARSMYILPFIHEVCPQVRLIHLIRDGRDMALSANQNQPRKHYAALFGRPLQDPEHPDPVSAIELWSRANLDAAAWGERHLGGRYIRVRFEELIQKPGETAEHLLAALNLQADSSQAVRDVVVPETFGIWRKQESDLIEKLNETGAAGLRSFGYL